MLKERIRKFLKTDLFKTSFWNGVATVIKMAAGLVTNKIIAMYLGPGGIAVIGQFRNFTTMVMNLSTLGINTAVTKYLAQSKENKLGRNRILSSGLYITLMGTIITSLIIFFNRDEFNRSILRTGDYSSIIIILSLTLILFTLNNFFIGVFNGFKKFKIIILRNILGSLLSLGVAIFLVIKFGLYGALLGVILSQTIIFLVLLGVISKAAWFSYRGLFNNFHFGTVKKFSNYTLMALVSTIFVTYIQLKIRTYIFDNLSTNDAGYWEAMIRISRYYLMVFTATLSLYYLPRFSEINSNVELRKEVLRGFKFLSPLLLLSSIVIIVCKKYVVQILYTDEFYLMLPLFKYQLIGDVLRILSWLLSFNLLAKTKTFYYVFSEIVFGLLFYFLTIFFVQNNNLVGTTYAYALKNLLYLLVMIVLFFKIFKVKK